jgi:excisionase family DNA binding protein
MNTYTYAELDLDNQVNHFGNLTDLELANLYLFGIRAIGSDHPAVTVWLRDQVDYERRVRAAGGRMERPIISIPYRWHIADVVHLAVVSDLLRDVDDMSPQCQAWWRSVHRTTMVIISAKAKGAAVNDRLLTVREACDCLGVTRDGLWKLVKDGKLKEPMKLAPRTYRFHPADIMGCMAGL